MFYGNAADVIVGANSRNATLAGLSSDPEVRISTIGIRCDAGCGPIHASSIVLRASTPWAGSIPAGSKIRGCYGIADQG